MSKSLVIYYSRRGQNYFGGSIRSIERGNAEILSEYIHEAVDADLFEVDTIKPYSEDYTTCTEEAMDELKAKARPELKAYLESIDDYDTIFVVGPCWWGTYPMAMFSQLERLDFNGKRVVPLMTHEGSGMGHSVQDLKKICKGAVFGESLAVRGSDTSRSKSKVQSWAKKNVG